MITLNFCDISNGKNFAMAVDPLDAVDSLNRNNKEIFDNFHIFIRNPVFTILQSAFSFTFYHLKDGDTIFLSKKYEKNLLEMVERQREEAAGARKKNTIVKGIELEKAKMRDIFFTRIEGTLNCHRKVVNRFQQIMNKPRKAKAETETVTEWSALDGPSTHMLPPVWQPEATNI